MLMQVMYDLLSSECRNTILSKQLYKTYLCASTASTPQLNAVAEHEELGFEYTNDGVNDDIYLVYLP